MPTVTQLIRDYAQHHRVFGVAEIRKLPGAKAASVASTMSRKGEFDRLADCGDYHSLTIWSARTESGRRSRNPLTARSRPFGSCGHCGVQSAASSGHIASSQIPPKRVWSSRPGLPPKSARPAHHPHTCDRRDRSARAGAALSCNKAAA